MTDSPLPELEFDHDDFNIFSIEDELEVDGRCQTLLKHFYLHLIAGGMTASAASELAYSADYYVRDYLLDFGRQNIARPKPGIVRNFAGSWFITRTLDPEMNLLLRHLEAVRLLYRFLHERHLVSAEELHQIEKELIDTEFYQERIDSFLAITGDGYVEWEAEFPLERL